MIDGSFLVRDKQPGIFVLTYAYNKKIFHYILNQDAVDGWVIHGNKNEKWGRTLECANSCFTHSSVTDGRDLSVQTPSFKLQQGVTILD